MNANSFRAILLVTLTVLPVTLVACWSASQYLDELLDPCMHWGIPSTFSVTLPPHPEPNNPCGGTYRGTSEKRNKEIVMLLLFPGVFLTAAVLALLGAVSCRYGLLIVSPCMMFLEAVVPFMSIAPALMLTGAALLLIAEKKRKRMGTRTHGRNEEPAASKPESGTFFAIGIFFSD